MKNIVVLNAPPRSGKDSVADALTRNRNNWNTASFKARLIKVARECTPQISDSVWDARYDTQKDEPWDRLGGLSQREYLIKISEEWIKPLFGKDYFGRAALVDIYLKKENVILIPDGGFIEEVRPLAENNKVLILQWERDKCSFDNDSRDYIRLMHENVRTKFIASGNNGTLFSFLNKVDVTIKEWILENRR